MVLCWDPVGQGERSQFWDRARGRSRYNLVCGEHAVLGNLATLAGTSLVRYAVWDGMRAVDYLLTRDDVDAERIAITGTSGGGFQSTWIGALDRRIRAVLPSCFPTALPMRMANRTFEDPDSDPEQDPPGLVSEGVDHPGLLLLAYPRPLHVSAAVLDFFPIEGTRKTMREVAALYRRFGHADDVAISEGYHKHQYSDENQAHAFAFLDRAFGRPAREGVEAVKTLPPETLRCTPSGQVREDLGGRSLVDVIRDEAAAHAPKDTLAERYRGAGYPGIASWPVVPFARAAPRAAIAWESAGSERTGRVVVDRYRLSHSGGLVLPLVHLHPEGARAGKLLLRVGLEGVGLEETQRAEEWADVEARACGRVRSRVVRPARARRDAAPLPRGLGRRSRPGAGERGAGVRRPALRCARQSRLQRTAAGPALSARARRGRRDRRPLLARKARRATARDRGPGGRAPAGGGRRRRPARPDARSHSGRCVLLEGNARERPRDVADPLSDAWRCPPAPQRTIGKPVTTDAMIAMSDSRRRTMAASRWLPFSGWSGSRIRPMR